jgi:nucleotidyltransferase substrate binding protein (TIGR01987 family)
MEDVRWKQRFQNFEKALHYLEQALQVVDPDIIHKAGLIQFFEMCYELSWNTLKDYLEEQGFSDVNSPRSPIKKAFEVELVSDGHLWLKLLEDRNLTAHAYDEVVVNEIETLIRNTYYKLFQALHFTLRSKL